MPWEYVDGVDQLLWGCERMLLSPLCCVSEHHPNRNTSFAAIRCITEWRWPLVPGELVCYHSGLWSGMCMSWMTCHAQNDLLGYRRKILDFFIDFYLLKKKKGRADTSNKSSSLATLDNPCFYLVIRSNQWCLKSSNTQFNTSNISLKFMINL